MTKHARWIKATESLVLSGCGRYALCLDMGLWSAFYFDSVGWGPIFEKPAQSLREAKQRIEFHRFHRPLSGAA